MTREISQLGQEYVTVAQVKGYSYWGAVWRHAFPNILVPLITVVGLSYATLLEGAVLTETVFAWPGIGRLMYEALLQRDYNLLLGIFVVCSAMVLIFNLVTDLVYRLVDPRIEFAA